jgi:hypothetical protein
VAGPYYTDGETKLLCRLVAEGHTPLSCAIVLNRSVLAIKQKANQLGLTFRRFNNGSVSFHLRIERQTFDTLRSVAHEIEVSPYRLARILLNVIAQRNKWAELLNLSDDERQDD